jgi:restriction endonuclease Mrr
MIMKKSLTAAAIALMGTGVAGTAFAAENTEQPNGRFGNIIEAIAEHFNVSVDEVQAIFKAQRQEMIENRIEKAETQLNNAVEDGTLTEEQADAIREHREDMREFMQSLEDMTQVERRAAVEAQREANKQWAEENNIPAAFLPLEGPHGHQGSRAPHGPHPEGAENNE